MAIGSSKRKNINIYFNGRGPQKADIQVFSLCSAHSNHQKQPPHAILLIYSEGRASEPALVEGPEGRGGIWGSGDVFPISHCQPAPPPCVGCQPASDGTESRVTGTEPNCCWESHHERRRRQTEHLVFAHVDDRLLRERGERIAAPTGIGRYVHTQLCLTHTYSQSCFCVDYTGSSLFPFHVNSLGCGVKPCFHIANAASSEGSLNCRALDNLAVHDDVGTQVNDVTKLRQL